MTNIIAWSLYFRVETLYLCTYTSYKAFYWISTIIMLSPRPLQYYLPANILNEDLISILGPNKILHHTMYTVPWTYAISISHDNIVCCTCICIYVDTWFWSYPCIWRGNDRLCDHTLLESSRNNAKFSLYQAGRHVVCWVHYGWDANWASALPRSWPYPFMWACWLLLYVQGRI